MFLADISVTVTLRQKLKKLHSGASSRSKNGDAYFSDVTGSIQDPIGVPGPVSYTHLTLPTIYSV